jgi:hypothetical protein
MHPNRVPAIDDLDGDSFGAGEDAQVTYLAEPSDQVLQRRHSCVTQAGVGGG